MEVIAEEEEDEDEDEDDDGSSSSGSGTEFIPSAWNREATPNRSALRSPEKKSDHKKNVSFKKQKYHSVYEYPRETSDSDSEGFDSPTHQHWNSLMLQSTQQPQVDYSSFADWELLDGDVVPDTDMDQDVPTENTAQQQLDFYKLSSVDCDFTNGMLSEDGEFYISSSARPFQFPGGNSDVLTSGSQFFPGQLYHTSSKCKPADITADFVTPDSGIIDVTLTEKLSVLATGLDSYDDEVDTSPSSMSRFVVSPDDYQLSNHSSDRIKEGVWEDEVDCGKYGVNETSVSQGKVSMESVKLQELPLTDILELAKTSDPTNTVLSTAITNEMSLGARPISTFVGADKDSEPTLQSPSSPLSPSGLGELRHTRDRLKLDLPVSSTTFVLEPPALGKRRSVETVKGEASLLDSGEETEDSGIESSNGVVTSLTREVKSLTEDTRKT
jgi:tyrosine kinase 2